MLPRIGGFQLDIEPYNHAHEDHSQAALERLAPPGDLVYVFIPGDGDVEPVPAGITKIDIDNGVLEMPHTTKPIVGPKQVLKTLQSGLLIVDGEVSIKIDPGYGAFPLYASRVVEGTGKSIRFIQIEADAPYTLLFVGSMLLSPPTGTVLSLPQFRYSDTTLTKMAPAAVNDSLSVRSAGIPFIARSVTKTLSQAKFGVNFIRTLGIGQKSFFIRNVSAVGVEVAIYGTMFRDVAVSLEDVSGLASQAWIEDPDISGSITGSPVLIGAGKNAVLETGINWGLIQLRARIVAAQAAGTTAEIIVEYSGFSPQIR